jgi:hypothetical protein
MHFSNRTTPNAAHTSRNLAKIVLWLSFLSSRAAVDSEENPTRGRPNHSSGAEGSVLVIHDLEIIRQNGRGFLAMILDYKELQAVN